MGVDGNALVADFDTEGVTVSSSKTLCEPFSHQFYYESAKLNADGSSDPAWLTLDQAAAIFTVNTVDPAHIGVHTFKYRAVLVNDPDIFEETELLELTITCTITAFDILATTTVPVSNSYALTSAATSLGAVIVTATPTMCPLPPGTTLEVTSTTGSTFVTFTGTAPSFSVSV